MTRIEAEPDLVLPQRVGEPITLRRAKGEDDHDSTDGQRLAVFLGGAGSLREGRLPIAGRYEYDGGFLRFTPAFSFVAGQDHVVRTRRSGEQPRLTDFRIPREATPEPAVVSAVYPSSDVLPENVLRFYLHFSVPMAPHRATEFVTLHDASGVADHAAFMKFKQELWNADRTRLTVLIDPGRIKRNVATNADLGPALLEEERYALVVGEGWPSADGLSVLPSFAKQFRVIEALRERPDVARWTTRRPRVGTRGPFLVTFDRPFDRHLLGKALQVVTSGGQAIDGTPLVGEREMSWSFTPVEPWTAPGMHLTVDETLEDIAGNNLRELLDREIGQQRPNTPGEVHVR